MLQRFHHQPTAQFPLALGFGFVFGFLLQKGGACSYDVILNQLLLKDFTVLKVMMSAILTGMIGVYAMHSRGWIKLHKKTGSVGTTIPGSIIFGIGFALLGYCPGTAIGAVGHGALDALIGGVGGILLGSALYAVAYPKLKTTVLAFGAFGDKTIIDLFRAPNRWIVILPVAAMIAALLLLLERAGL